MKNLLFITLISLFNINATEFIYLTHFELPYDFRSEDMEASTIITKSNGSFVWGSEHRNIFLAVNEKTNVYKFEYFVDESERKTNIISIKTINGKVIIDEEHTDVYFRYRNNPFSILETLSVDGFQLYQYGEMYNHSKHVRIKEGTPEIIGEK